MSVLDYVISVIALAPTVIALAGIYRTRTAVTQWQSDNPDGVVSSWVGNRGAVIGAFVLVAMAALCVQKVVATGESLHNITLTPVIPALFLAGFIPAAGASENGVFKTTLLGALQEWPWSAVVSFKDERKSVSNILLKGGEAITVNRKMNGGNGILLMVRDRIGGSAYG